MTALRRGNCAEDERRHHAEAGGAGPPQRPEEVRLVVLVARDDTAVGQHELGREHPVGRESVAATEHAKAPAQCQPCDPDGGAGPGGKGTVVQLEAVRDRTQAGAGTDRDQVAVRRHEAHRRDVEHDAGARRGAGEAVAAAAYGERQVMAAKERQRRRHIGRRRAPDRRPGTNVVEPGVERGRLGVEDDAAVDGRLQPVPTRTRHHHRVKVPALGGYPNRVSLCPARARRRFRTVGAEWGHRGWPALAAAESVEL